MTTEVGFKDSKGILLPFLNKIRTRVTQQDYDAFIVVCGKERRGKSTLAAKIAWYISQGNMTADNICMEVEEFLQRLKASKKGEIIIFDEAGTALYSRDAMTNVNRMLTKSFMVSGIKNVCILICIPSFFNLDSYIRNHRIDLLINIPDRGKFKVYSAKKAKEISQKGVKYKKVDVVKANTVGWFTKEFPEKLEEEYRKKETKFKTSFIKDIKDNLEGMYTTTKFCQVTGYSLRHLMRWIKAKEVKAKKIGGRWYIPKAEAERIVSDEYEENDTRSLSSKATMS